MPIRDLQETPFPRPPDRPAFEPFPTEVPWDIPIFTLGWWLEIVCSGCDMKTNYPLQLLAAEIGWRRTLRQIVPRLKCRVCRSRPESVKLTKDGAGSTGRAGYVPPELPLWEKWRLVGVEDGIRNGLHDGLQPRLVVSRKSSKISEG